MREDIGLFRGKRLDNGEWVQGYLCIICGKTFIMTQEGIDNAFIRLKYPPHTFEGDLTKVAPATVGEYTGLKDKNGKRIFEGDIIGAIDFFDGEIIPGGVVKYGTFNCGCCNGVYGWYIDGGDIRDANSSMFEPSVLVIGNIHDNPELLEV